MDATYPLPALGGRWEGAAVRKNLAKLQDHRIVGPPDVLEVVGLAQELSEIVVLPRTRPSSESAASWGTGVRL